jgi:hypothetical protein
MGPYFDQNFQRTGVEKERLRGGVRRGQQMGIDDSNPYGCKGCLVKKFMH